MSALGGRLIARINCMVPVKSMFILVGLSGSGKSTWIQSFIEKHNLRNYALASADDYFSLSGKYIWDPTKLEDAHYYSYKTFVNAYKNNTPYIFIDNTNLNSKERDRYILPALNAGYDVYVKVLPANVSFSAEHNIHGTAVKTLEKQRRRLDLSPGEYVADHISSDQFTLKPINFDMIFSTGPVQMNSKLHERVILPVKQDTPYSSSSIFKETVAVVPFNALNSVPSAEVESVADIIAAAVPEVSATKVTEEPVKPEDTPIKYKGKHAHMTQDEFLCLMHWVEEQTLCPSVPKEARLHLLEWLQDLQKECNTRLDNSTDDEE